MVHVSGVIEPDIVAGPEPWDIIQKSDIKPHTVELVYLGHVLEHIPWGTVVGFLRTLRYPLCAPGATVMAVGPDVLKTIRGYQHGKYDDKLIRDVIEDDLHYQPDSIESPDPQRSGARHAWNCYEDRLVRAFQHAGYEDIARHTVNQNALMGWPVTSFVDWQCAVSGKTP